LNLTKEGAIGPQSLEIGKIVSLGKKTGRLVSQIPVNLVVGIPVSSNNRTC